jgi:hypothetical protein
MLRDMDADHDLDEAAAGLLSQPNCYTLGMLAPVPLSMQFPVEDHGLDSVVDNLPFTMFPGSYGLFGDQAPLLDPELLPAPSELSTYRPAPPPSHPSSLSPLPWPPVANRCSPPRTIAELPQDPSPAPVQPTRRRPGRRSNPDCVNNPQPRRRRGAQGPTDRVTSMRGAAGAVVRVLPLGPRNRAPLTGDKVESTARTRQLGACADCKRNKWRVSPDCPVVH